MKQAIVTLIYGETYEKLAQTTLPFIQSYSKKINADLVILKNDYGFTMPHYAKLEMRRVLQEYSRACFVDIDVLINPKSPNIFEVVPEDKLGLFEEGHLEDRKVYMARYCALFNPVIDYEKFWRGEYYNTGVMVCSKQHRDLFVIPDKHVSVLGEQSYLNLLFAFQKTAIQELDYKWNHQISLI
jgi:hypothetical protein